MSDVTGLREAVLRARGCGCCATYTLPDDCPTDEEFTDHTYNTGCSHDFDSLLDRLIEAVRQESQP